MGAQRRQLNVGWVYPLFKKQAHGSRPPERLIFLEAAGQSVISPREASEDDASDRGACVITQTRAGRYFNGCRICKELEVLTC